MIGFRISFGNDLMFSNLPYARDNPCSSGFDISFWSTVFRLIFSCHHLNIIKTLAKASEAQHSEGAKELYTHVYMDDIGNSRENKARLKKVTNEIDAILSTEQFQVKAWHSNNKNVNQSDN